MEPHLGTPPITARSVVMGLLFSVALCAMNSYLTLSFGVIEEGPTIAALFFFALMLPFGAKRITTTEMVIVATMGSAGGSLGFISNFYAAKAMTGEPYSVLDMALFGSVSSLVGLAMAIPLRQLLILKEDLPWPGSKAVETVVRTLVEKGDPRQAVILLGSFLALCAYVVLNDEDGFAAVPSALALGGLATYGGWLALSPFAIGSAYLMGLRTGVGFLVGAVLLMAGARWFGFSPVAHPQITDAPQKYYWPGLGFLVASGLTALALNWRTITLALRSMVSLRGQSEDPDPPLRPKLLLAFATVAFVSCALVLNLRFALNMALVVMLVVVAGLIQNIIATRAAAQTNFNPARVMGILLQGITALFGGKSAAVNLTGAGFVSGSGAQASLLTADMVYGRVFRVPSRWQFWTQTLTVVPCAIASAYMFDWILSDRTRFEKLSAPVAKVWAESANIFDQGFEALPAGASNWLLGGAIFGVAYVLVEHVAPFKKWLPESTGIGLGLVLAPALSLGFFVGAFLTWIVLGRWLKWSDATLTTIAVASIVAEGIGGVLKPLLHAFLGPLAGFF
ncbi:MAG: hypothetical protein FJ298_13775 [Planctomycetes bacterium]|nr:hypothetical protein [Planctomycetota bacterium]